MASVKISSSSDKSTSQKSPSSSSASIRSTSSSSETSVSSPPTSLSEANYRTLEAVWKALLQEDRRPTKGTIGAPDAEKPSKRLSKQRIVELLKMAIKIFEREDTLLQIEAPMTVCGDIHGQYSDLLDILDKLSWPPAQRYLFMGDYVDRGPQSIEVICLLLYMKIKYPEDVFLLRGNHETGEINATFGFRTDCLKYYDVFVWDLFLECFRHLPLVGLISSRIVCMHGGISPHFETLDDINKLVRPFEVPDMGLACDLLWSDPLPSTKVGIVGFVPNDIRKTSYWFARDAVEEFLKRNNLELIVRGHEMISEGYTFHFERHLVTIFSAPQYCGFHNDAAVLKVSEDLKCQVIVFKFKRAPIAPKRLPQSDIITSYGSFKTSEPWNEVTLREPVLPITNTEVCEVVKRAPHPPPPPEKTQDKDTTPPTSTT